METLEGYFTDADIYNDTVSNWDLNYKLLSKSDFSCEMKMIYNENFSLVREKITGKIDQKGKTQEDFIVFGIPVNGSSFYWFDKKIGVNDLVIFPKGNNFDVVSYDTHDVYVISIHESVFYNALQKVGTDHFNALYDGSPQNLFLDNSFSTRFTKLLNYFLNTDLQNEKKNDALIETIVVTLIEYLNGASQNKTKGKRNKKDIALKKAVKIIDNQIENLYSIPQLCVMVGVSERTLLYAFKEKYKVSPSAYIKSHRLNRVKQEIYNTNSEAISIIAAKYSFWHMGQFAKDFKKQFGILPSEVRKAKTLNNV